MGKNAEQVCLKKRDRSDLTGYRFGRLTILKKGNRASNGYQMWHCCCDCGSLVQRDRRALKRSKTPSCGCFNRERFGAISTARAKPDPTGQRFGRLTVIGRDPVKHPGKNRTRWLCRCDCGNITSLVRGDFDKEGGAKSCGCLYRDRKGKPHANAANYRGQKFGNLTALSRVSNKLIHGKPVWLCRCDCGREVERSTLQLRQGYGKGVNCGDRAVHGWGLWYPPTPSPYPSEAGEIVAKYLKHVDSNYRQIDQAVQDEKMDRLIRAAWIVVYRRSQGEELDAVRERRFILKHLRYCGLIVYWRRKVERYGGIAYSMDGVIKRIGGEMTDLTFQDYPVSESETPGINILSKSGQPKKLRFKRR